MAKSEMDLFFYNGDEVYYEDLRHYEPCGLHPVLLGDILPLPGTCVSDEAKQPRYRIFHKLGFGSFSTVWLARDLVDERFVAVKLRRGTDQPVQSNEVEILRHLHENGKGKPGYSNIIDLYDVFTIRGPNGFHECLITEVVIPLGNARDQCPPRQTTQQLLRGFGFLHSQGVVHGDPHNANFGIAIPQLQEFDENEIAYDLDPQAIVVVPRDPSFPIDSVPRYTVETVDLGSFVESKKRFPSSEEVCLKILDFGRACRTDKFDKDLPGAAPPPVRPPEVFMYFISDGKIGTVWSKEADIWAVGCIAYTILTGCGLFSCQGTVETQLYDTLRLGGAPPKEWFEFWDLEKLSERRKGSKEPLSPVFDVDKSWESRRDRECPQTNGFWDFIRRMVTTDPTRRSQMAELADHPFLTVPQREIHEFKMAVSA